MKATVRSRCRRGFRRVVSATGVVGLAAYGLLAMSATGSPAVADTMPAAGTPATVSADSLPTWQINGVVWSSAVVGNTVYATGSFTQARPPGSAAGQNEVARSNLLAYDITTGNLITSFNHSLNAQGLRVVASPDGSRIYVGGDFTTVDGVTRNHIAAFNTATGALDPNFKPSVNNEIRSIAATNTNVYFGGSFTYVNGLPRTRLAEVSAAGTLSTTWLASADDETVYAMVLTPDQSRLIVGGRFTSLDGQTGHVAVGALDATTGAISTWNYQPYNAPNGKQYSYVTDLTTDGTNIFAANDGEGGAYFDGRWAATPDTGTMIWQDSCYGATYGVFTQGSVLYSVSHAHDCSSLGTFPDTNPRTWHRALAETTYATGTDATNSCANCTSSNYGKPIPTQLDWYPTVNIGSYTGQGQGAWTVSGNGKYVALGGEFTQINNAGQQGLARFAVSSIAPNKSGPQVTASSTPTIVSLSSGSARLSWQTAWDMDNETLTYKVFRYGTSTPIYTTTAASRFYNQPYIGYIDTGLTPGATYKYYVQISDPYNNSVNTATSSVTVSSTNSSSAYTKDVIGQGASDYWRLDESSGTTAYDYAGFSDLATNSGVTNGAPGALVADADTADTFDGSTGLAATMAPTPGPNVFTEEAWFKTSSTAGGMILGFGNANTGNSSSYDRHIYMDGSGTVYFGVYNNGAYTVNTGTGYNDGQWHQAVGTLSSTGMVFYVDGKKVGTNTGTTVGQAYNGYWRVGGDSTWAGAPYLSGSIDEVSIYPTALSLTQVRQQYLDSGRSIAGATAPSDKYGAAVYNDSPDSYWRLDESSGSTAQDLSGNGADGVYSGNPTLGVPGVAGKATTFNGNGDTLASKIAVQGPTTYTEELWFNTTTTAGGKLIGFGNQQSGNSSAYDRHVYMETNGQLTFGTYTGQLNTTTSTKSYNDGNWHYLVASQGSDGMKLYVDGQLVGTNPQTGQQAYTGYWRVGGDTAWNGTTWFNGTVDEVAIYSKVLTQSQITAHYNASSAVNHAPTAMFTQTTSGLTASFDGSSSSDVDGPIASYAWDYGDGSTGSGATSTHPYASAGTYPVTLVVTDGGGLTSTASGTVTVAKANVAPTASFSHSENNLIESVDATASSDSDGSIASYAWDFGDGGSATGATASHTYAKSGKYTITLTVTDNQGATGTQTASVTVQAANVPPTAALTTSMKNLTLTGDATGSTDSDGTIASYAWDYGDGTNGTGATISHAYASPGSYTVKVTVTDNSGATDSKSATVTATAGNAAPVASFTSTVSGAKVTFDGTGSSDPDGTVASYAWDFGDGTTGTGATTSRTYTASGSYSVKLTVTDNSGATNSTSSTVVVTLPNVAPTASFTSKVTGLSVALDGSASKDSDGSIASYAWDYGDGSTGSGVSPSHPYTKAGSYTVKLTVTDNQGATNATSSTVTISPTVIASDDFGRTVTNGFGTADVGGAWTTTSTASNFGVSGGSAKISMKAAGSGPGIYLGAVSSSDTDTTVKVSSNMAGTGGGIDLSLVGRRVSTNDYNAKVRLLPNGVVRLGIYRTDTSGNQTAIVADAVVTGLTYTPGDVLNVRFLVSGTGTTSLKAKVWKNGTTEPTTWTQSGSDTTAALQAAGSVGVKTYLSSSSTNAPVVATYTGFRCYQASTLP